MAHAHCILMTKATNTHSEYVKPIAFPVQQWLQERASMSRLYANCLSCQYLDYPRNFVKWFLSFGLYDQNSVHTPLLCHACPNFPPSRSLITSHSTTTRCEVPERDISSSLALLNAHSSYTIRSVPWRPLCHPNYSYAPHNDVSANDGPHIRRWSNNII
jgi:hypothetical protein